MFSSPRETYGRWAEPFLGADSLATPHLMPVQAATISRTTAPGRLGAAWGAAGHDRRLGDPAHERPA